MGFGLAGGGVLEPPGATFGPEVGGDQFGAIWSFLAPFWASGSQIPFWCLLGRLGATSGLVKGLRKPLSSYLGCDGG